MNFALKMMNFVVKNEEIGTKNEEFILRRSVARGDGRCDLFLKWILH